MVRTRSFPPAVVANYAPCLEYIKSNGTDTMPYFINEYLNFLGEVKLMEPKDKKVVHTAIRESVYWQDMFMGYMRTETCNGRDDETIKKIKKEISSRDKLYRSLCVCASNAKNF